MCGDSVTGLTVLMTYSVTVCVCLRESVSLSAVMVSVKDTRPVLFRDKSISAYYHRKYTHPVCVCGLNASHALQWSS